MLLRFQIVSIEADRSWQISDSFTKDVKNPSFTIEIHYLGRKLRGARDVHVWFGGKSMKVSKLLEIVANELNVSRLNAKSFPSPRYMKIQTRRIKTNEKINKTIRINQCLR